MRLFHNRRGEASQNLRPPETDAQGREIGYEVPDEIPEGYDQEDQPDAFMDAMSDDGAIDPRLWESRSEELRNREGPFWDPYSATR